MFRFMMFVFMKFMSMTFMSIMTMYYRLLLLGSIFTSVLKKIVLRPLYRDLLAGLDLPGSGIFQLYRFSKYRNAGLTGIQSVRYRKENN